MKYKLKWQKPPALPGILSHTQLLIATQLPGKSPVDLRFCRVLTDNLLLNQRQGLKFTGLYHRHLLIDVNGLYQETELQFLTEYVR